MRARDGAYRHSVEKAAEHHLAHSDWLRRPRDDRLAEAELDVWKGECCPQCGLHPSSWTDIRRPELVPEWKFCKPCQLWQTAEAAGPPGEKDERGWHLVWRQARYDAD